MRRFRWLAVSLAVLLAAGMLAVAKDDGDDAARSRRQRGDQGARGKAPLVRSDGFLFLYMRNNERYESAFEDYRKSQQAILEAMKQIHETTSRELKDATTDEAREQIIADSKARSREQLTRLVAGMIEHRKTITTMIEDDEAAIVDSAIAKIYERRRPPEDGDRADGPGPRRGRVGMGGDDMPPPPPPGY